SRTGYGIRRIIQDMKGLQNTWYPDFWNIPICLQKNILRIRQRGSHIRKVNTTGAAALIFCRRGGRSSHWNVFLIISTPKAYIKVFSGYREWKNGPDSLWIRWS